MIDDVKHINFVDSAELTRSCRQYLNSCDVSRSTDYGDELTWGAAWLYRATNESQYLDEAEHHYMKFRLKERPNEFFYNKKVAGVQVRITTILTEVSVFPYLN